jgi:hypothetical protein
MPGEAVGCEHWGVGITGSARYRALDPQTGRDLKVCTDQSIGAYLLDPRSCPCDPVPETARPSFAEGCGTCVDDVLDIIPASCWVT